MAYIPRKKKLLDADRRYRYGGGGSIITFGGGAPQITIQEVDGAPSVANATILQVDESDGFVLSEPIAGVARLDVADGGIVRVTASQTLTNKTLTVPTIGDFSNANHNHSNAAGGGTLSAAVLTSGTLPDGRFPATLPAVSGANLTNLNASALVNGTLSDARLSANVTLGGNGFTGTGNIVRQTSPSLVTPSLGVASATSLVASSFVEGLLRDKGGFVFNAKAYGAVGDAIRLSDCSISATSNILTASDASFTSADVGKAIIVDGAGAAGVPLITTIAGFTNSTTVTLTDNASTTVVSGGDAVYGTNNNTPFTNALAALSASGGTVIVPPGDYMITATITIGDGSSSAQSTKQNIGFRGAGPGFTESELATVSGATRILWCGAANGTMLTINGPISGLFVSDLFFDAGPLNTTVVGADTAIKTNHLIHSRIARITARRFRGVAFDLHAYPSPTGVVIGANENTWVDINARSGIGASAIGLRVGETTIGSSPFLDVANNTFINCAFGPGTTSGMKGIELRYTDSLTFIHCSTLGDIGLQISAPSDSVDFPSSITMINTPLGGTTTIAVSGTWTPANKISLLPHQVGDGQAIPSNAGFVGFTSEHQYFGNWYNKTLLAKAAANTPLILKGAASQSGDLLKLRNSSDTDLTVFTSDGRLLLPDGSSGGVAIGRKAANTGFYFGPNYIVFMSSLVQKFFFEDNADRGFILASDSQVAWGSTTNATATAPDTGLIRAVPGVVRVNDGTTGGTVGGTHCFPARTAAQITANQNNYNPGGTSKLQRWSSDASRNVTGLTFATAQVDGQEHVVWNVGSQNIVLTHQDAASTAANRFICSTGANLTLTPNKCAILIYDGTSSRWRVHLGN